MTATLSGLVIGTQSLMAARIVIPDSDDELDAIAAALPPGLSMVKVPRAMLPVTNGHADHALPGLLEAASQVLGQTIIEKQRHALVDALGRVVDVHFIDPILMQPPQQVPPQVLAAVAAVAQVPIVPLLPFAFVRHDTAVVGGTIIAGTYTAPPDIPAVAVIS